MSLQLSPLVSNSWWPLTTSFFLFSVISSMLMWLKLSFTVKSYLLSLTGLTMVVLMWLRDVIREGTYQGHHVFLVQEALKWGLVWFLFSEVWFFFSIFWSFFHFSTAPLTTSGMDWPPMNTPIIPPFQVPLLNTAVLIMSGISATLAHNEILISTSPNWMRFSVTLGVYFLLLQLFEYNSASFSMASGVYGSIFFLSTGFHGLHVFLGIMALSFACLRMPAEQINCQHHFGLEFSLWYWHFVDVVWLLLFVWVYAWGK